jgi:LL-diaminopimelate aminotransferase
VLGALGRGGVRVAGSEATMYLWAAAPDGETSEAFANRLLEAGVLVAPGSFLGASGEGYVRFALVPTEQECEHAVDLLDSVLAP